MKVREGLRSSGPSISSKPQNPRERASKSGAATILKPRVTASFADKSLRRFMPWESVVTVYAS
jgi:hypothetical protein